MESMVIPGSTATDLRPLIGNPECTEGRLAAGPSGADRTDSDAA